jgi:hypothetical protein
VIVERLSTQSALQIKAKEKKIEFIKTKTQKKKKNQAEHRGTRFPLASPSPPPGAPGVVAAAAPPPPPPRRPSSCLMMGLLLRCGV